MCASRSSKPIVADFGGLVKFVDIIEEQTVREELDESTGRRQLVIIEDREKKLHPMIEIWDAKGSERLREFIVPYDAIRKAHSPDDTLLAFFQTTYDAAATLATGCRW